MLVLSYGNFLFSVSLSVNSVYDSTHRDEVTFPITVSQRVWKYRPSPSCTDIRLIEIHSVESNCSVKGPIHSKFNCVKKLHEKLNWMFSGTVQVSHQVCQFFWVSSVCLLVRVTVVDKSKAVVCCLLATSAIMLSEKKKRKRKMWSKKWYLGEYIMRCSSAEWIARNGCALRWCHRGVGR